MARTEEREVTGIFLGGVVPLEGVGFVMAELYRRGAHPSSMNVAPAWKEPKVKHLENGGISGLLPGAAKGVDRIAPLLQKLNAAGQEGLSKEDAIAILQTEGRFTAAKTKYYALVKDRVLAKKRGRVFIGSKAPALSEGPMAEVKVVTGEKTKQTVARDLILSKGDQPTSREDIRAAWRSELGIKSKHWDNGPVRALLNEKVIVRLKRGAYGPAQPSHQQ